MNYKIVLSADAHHDIDETIEYFINNLKNNIAAKNLLTEIEKAYNNISENPFKYSVCNDEKLRLKSYRKLIINNYIMIYRVDKTAKTVYIIRFVYVRRDYTELL